MGNDLSAAPQIFQLIATILAALYAICFITRDESLWRSLLKTLPVVCLALAAVSGNASIIIIAALLCCAAGDYFLSREGDNNFLAGLGSFLIGHVLYIIFFIGSIDLTQLITRESLLLIVILAALATLVVIRLWPHLGDLKLPVIIYSIVITAMAVSAKAANPGQIVLFGVTLFVISDIILAHEKFTPLRDTLFRKLMPYLVWVLYFVGQLFIVHGIL